MYLACWFFSSAHKLFLLSQTQSILAIQRGSSFVFHLTIHTRELLYDALHALRWSNSSFVSFHHLAYSLRQQAWPNPWSSWILCLWSILSNRCLNVFNALFTLKSFAEKLKEINYTLIRKAKTAASQYALSSISQTTIHESISVN